MPKVTPRVCDRRSCYKYQPESKYLSKTKSLSLSFDEQLDGRHQNTQKSSSSPKIPHAVLYPTTLPHNLPARLNQPNRETASRRVVTERSLRHQHRCGLGWGCPPALPRRCAAREPPPMPTRWQQSTVSSSRSRCTARPRGFSSSALLAQLWGEGGRRAVLCVGIC